MARCCRAADGLTDNRDGFHFLMAGAHLGKVLTPEMGQGLTKGNFEYAVEVFPFWQSYTPKFQKASCFAVPTAGTSLVGPGLYCSALYTAGGTFTGASPHADHPAVELYARQEVSCRGCRERAACCGRTISIRRLVRTY